MTYYIYMADLDGYKLKNKHKLFYIVQRMHDVDDKRELWQTRVTYTPVVDGIVHFIKKQYGNDKFDYEQFIKETEEFSNLNSELFEKYDNSPKPFKDAKDFNNTFKSILEEKIKVFCNKYGLHIGID